MSSDTTEPPAKADFRQVYPAGTQEREVTQNPVLQDLRENRSVPDNPLSDSAGSVPVGVREESLWTSAT